MKERKKTYEEGFGLQMNKRVEEGVREREIK